MAATPRRASREKATSLSSPPPLPPVPPLDFVLLQKLLARASTAIGRLDAVADAMPNKNLLLYYCVRKEAVLSSQIDISGKGKERLYVYSRLMEILERGAEPIAY